MISVWDGNLGPGGGVVGVQDLKTAAMIPSKRLTEPIRSDN